MNLDQFQAAIERVSSEIGKVIIGQQDAIRQSLVVILTNQQDRKSTRLNSSH